MIKHRPVLVIASLYGLLSVALGAFGAHALKEYLECSGYTETWKTAVDYQMWHALAIIAIAALNIQGKAAKWALKCFAVGILIFSGSLYGLALGGPKWLGPVTPIGGSLLILGWFLVLVSVLKAESNAAQARHDQIS